LFSPGSAEICGADVTGQSGTPREIHTAPEIPSVTAAYIVNDMHDLAAIENGKQAAGQILAIPNGSPRH
jgi:hypothetical protein